MLENFQWESLHLWNKLTDEVCSINEILLQNTPGFELAYDFLKTKPPTADVLRILNEQPNAINAFVYLLRNQGDFFDTYLSEDNILNFLKTSLTQTDEYTQRLFKISFLENIYKKGPVSFKKLSEIVKVLNRDTLIDNAFLDKVGLFKAHPIRNLAEYCLNESIEPKEMVQRSKIELSYMSHTFKLLECMYILKRIEAQDLTVKSELPSEIKRGNYFEAYYSEEELLGHQILKAILTDLDTVELHEDWVDLILNIASDPRSSKGTDKYIKWWSKLPQSLIDNFIKVLSHNDIILFLEAIYEYAEESRNADMQRMYERRKKLLKNLAVNGLIDESRLILPRNAKQFIRRTRPELDQSFILNLNEHNGLCLIYLRIGNLHIIEGSHNFAVRIHKGLNEMKKLMNPARKNTTYSEITRFGNRFNNTNNQKFEKITHDSSGRWIQKLVRIIKNEVKVNSSSF